jgi:UDP-glucose 4-epimerase
MGHQVVVLDDLSGGYRDQVPEGAVFVHGSVTDNALVSSLFEEFRFQYVYHLAAYAAECLSHFIRRFNYTNNLIGSVNLINEAVKHDVECFVFTSSIAVYGHGQVPMVESMTPQPKDPYGIAKLSVEMDLQAAREMWGLNYIVFRPHNVYGERQNTGDPYRNVIGIFISQAMKGEPMTIFGDGLQTRAFSHVDDVAPVIARSVHVPEAYGQVFNIGADEPHTVLEVAQEVARALGVPAKIRHLPPRNEVVHAYASHDKARRVFGIGPQVALREGISRMAEWVKKHGVRQSRVFSSVEVPRGLPSTWAQLLEKEEANGSH